MRTKFLEKALLELLHELRNTNINLIIGGGYGILLRVEDRKNLALELYILHGLMKEVQATLIYF